MKKKFSKLVILSLLTLASAVSCSKTETSGSVSSNASSSAAVESSTSSVSDVKITYSTIKSSYEVGETFTLRFTVSTSSSEKKLKFELKDQSESSPCVTGTDKSSLTFNDGVSVALYAKKKGSATLVATSLADESVSVEIKLNIVSPVATLQNVWKKVNALSNYTLDITREPTLTELNEHDTWTEDTMVPFKKVEVTENALITKVADEVADDVTKTTYKSSFTTTTGNEIVGLAADKDGYGFILGKDSTGYNSASTSRITGSQGYVSKTNLSGYGDDTSSPNDVFVQAVSDTQYISFGGLRVVNSSWLSSFTKDYSNEYELVAEDGATTAVQSNIIYAKLSLWELIDIDGFMEAAATDSTFAGIANHVSVTVKALSSNNVEVTLETETNTYHATLSEIGTTTLDTALTTYLGTATTEAPELAGDYKLVIDAFKTYDFYVASETKYGTYYQFFYKNYYFEYYPEAFVKAYAAAGYENLTSYGYAMVGNNAYQFTFTDEVTDSTGAVTTPAKVTMGTDPIKNTSGTAIDYSQVSDKELAFATTIGSYAASYTFGYPDEAGLIYSFKAYQGTSGGTVYVSESKTVSDELSSIYFGGSTVEEVIAKWGYTFDSYSTQLEISKSTATDETTGQNVTTVTSVRLGFGTFSVDSQSGYMYPVTITFGHAANKFHSTITDAITAKAGA